MHPQLLTQRQVLEDERAGPAAEQNHDLNSPHQPGDHRPASPDRQATKVLKPRDPSFGEAQP